MTYRINTVSYNERRYGKPWIARVVGREFVWGEWIGRPGEAGELRIDCEPGDLVAQGQKDLRKGRGGVDMYYMAMPNGCLWWEGLGTEAAARRWHDAGWRAYAEFRMNDTSSKNEIRIAAAKMLGVQDPISRAAAEFFGLVDPEPEAKPVEVSMDAFGL